MAKGRGQKASEAPRSINQALGELRGLVREQPYDLGRMARLVHQFAPNNRVLVDYIHDLLPSEWWKRIFDRQLKLTPYLVSGQRVPVPDDIPMEWRFLDLSRANLEAADFPSADLEGANFAWANLINVNFERANLSGASLQGADITYGAFQGARMRGAELAGAVLHSGHFVEADMRGADLSGVRLIYSDMSDANLSNANLSNADLYGSELSNTDFTGANLRGALLYGVILQGANVSGADLTGSLHDNETWWHVRSLRYDAATIWPEDFDMSRLG